MNISAADKNALNQISNTVTETSQGYNQLSDDVKLGDLIEGAGFSGQLTLSLGLSTVVLSTVVQADDRIFVQGQNTSAATLDDLHVNPVTIVPGVSFTITHSVAVGVELVAFLINR